LYFNFGMLQNNILYTKLLLNQAKCIPGKTKVGVLYEIFEIMLIVTK